MAAERVKESKAFIVNLQTLRIQVEPLSLSSLTLQVNRVDDASSRG